MNENKLRILHLLSQRPDSTGSGIYIQAMMREAEKKGHLNFLVAGIQDGQVPQPEGVSEKNSIFVRFDGTDIPDLIVGMSDVMPYDSRRFRDLTGGDIEAYEAGFEAKLKAAVARFKPDLIHSHHLWILTALARRTYPDLSIVTSCHGSDLRQFKNCDHLRDRVLSGCSKIDWVMALSERQREEITGLYGIPEDRIAVTGAGYNDKLFRPGSKPGPDPVEVVYAGKLSLAKGVPWLLRAMAKIDGINWRLHLVGGGSGPEKDSCLNIAQSLGKRVVIHGAVSQSQLATRMRRSHIFVLPSFYEGLPLVVLEALACGCRIVATRLPGLKEIVKRIGNRFIREVALPRLKNVDTPYPEDEPAFEENLSAALKAQMGAVIRYPVIDSGEIRDKTAAFSWTGVFKGVEKIYYQSLKQSNPN